MLIQKNFVAIISNFAYFIIYTTESTLYICLRYEKNVKSTGDLIRYVNVYKNQITLPSCQSLNLSLILEDNITRYLDFLSDNNEKNIGL